MTSRPRTDHVAAALQYAQDVDAGVIPACRWVRLACRRHLDDLKRAENPDFPYYFSPKKAAKPCIFIEFLPHTKGKWRQKRELIHLEPWQCFLITTLFGWLKRSNNRRRFTEVYWEIPRKNGKSVIAAGIGLYMLSADGEAGPEVYCGATTEKQAWEVFKPARLMMLGNEALADRCGLDIRAKIIMTPKDGGKFEPLIGNPGDGSSPSCAIVDEFHEHDTPDLYNTMETGMGAREQPILLAITTAGSNIAGPCYDKHEQARRILDGTMSAVGDHVFACMWGLDPEDDWASPATLRKANPNFGVSVDADWLTTQQRTAMHNPTKQNAFKTKHLNVWTSVLAGVMNMQQWSACEDRTLDESAFISDPCWIANDLASKSDLCASQRLYKRTIDGDAHYYLFGSYWLPDAAMDDEGPNRDAYAKWEAAGWLTRTDGATVDFALITDSLVATCREVNPEEVVFDPFNATQMMQAVMAQNITTVEFVQVPQNFAVPLDDLTTAVKDGRFHHDGNPITTWCMGNMVARPAKKGLVSPIKQKPHQKIDGAIAAIMCIARAAVVARDNWLGDYLNSLPEPRQ